MNAIFSTGSFVETCAGGGRGGLLTCSWSFKGYFDGTLLVGGNTQAITGVTSEIFGADGSGATGSLAYNSTYLPFYFSDGNQIHRSDDLKGSNLLSFGNQGSGVGQFAGASAIALDSTGRIYVADTYNCRIVRFDNMNGDNWTSFGGSCGSGAGQFNSPSGVAVSASGAVYVMDSGNGRVVKMDDLNGTNWSTYGSLGTGDGQFAPYTTSLAIDNSSRIYIADTGNARVVRIDDITGTNWTTLTKGVPSSGSSTFSLQSPVAVTIDTAGRIYVGDNEATSPAIVRVDDMTGANWTSIYLGGGNGINSVSIDARGTVFTEDGGVRFVDGMLGVLAAPSTNAVLTSYYVFGVTPVGALVLGSTQSPPPITPASVSISPSTLDFSSAGAPAQQNVTLTNTGGSPLTLFGAAASGPFTILNNCPPELASGVTCSISISLAASGLIAGNGLLTIQDNSTNMGTSQTVTLLGPVSNTSVTVLPLSLTFPAASLTVPASNQIVTLSNTGNTGLNVTSVTVSGPFTATNQCQSTILPGGSCTISVISALTSSVSAAGTLSIIDSAGRQVVTLSASTGNQLTFTPTTLHFGGVAVGQTSPIKIVHVFNKQKAPIGIASVLASSDFRVVGNTCAPVLSPASGCSVAVTFSPALMGSKLGSLNFTEEGSSSAQTVTLLGAGRASFTVSARQIDFGSVSAGEKSELKTLTIMNHQSTGVKLTTTVAAGEFSILTNTCGELLDARTSCTLGILFVPNHAGATSDILTITDDADGHAFVVQLRGKALPRKAQRPTKS